MNLVNGNHKAGGGMTEDELNLYNGMSYSKSPKFRVKSYRKYGYDAYKLSEALKKKQALKLMNYKIHCTHDSPEVKKMKKKKKKNLYEAPSHLKNSTFQAENYRGSKHDSSKSSRCAKTLKKKHITKLLAYYKSLCRSSKCYIHNSSSSERTKRDSKTKVYGMRSTGDFDKTFSLETIDINLYKKIESSVEDIDSIPGTLFSDIVGHSQIRDILNKTLIWPLKKPETFKGLRAAPKGVLLFGPPGAGKASLVKLIALETSSTFFNVSASTLTSKSIGESEKLVRVLFLVARARQPSIIFIDDVHSILPEKTKDENDSTKRMKNEFLSCMNCIETLKRNRIVVIGSSSRPQDIDERLRPKFAKRIHVTLPNKNDREEILLKLLECECHSLELADVKEVVEKTNGFSILDLKNLCQEAAMSSIKALSGKDICNLKPNRIRPISLDDFESALKFIKPTVSEEQIKACEFWDVLYGYGERENTN